MTAMDSQKTLGAKGASVLEEAGRRRRRTIRWPEDSDWLSEITPAPKRLLSRLKDSGLLYAAGTNRFVIAPPGARSIRQAASPELLADLAFRPHGDYYVGFLSGLIAHHLTDLHSELTYVAMLQGTKPRKVPDDFKVAELPAGHWPTPESEEIERVRISDSKEFFYRSSIERTLVDSLLRPDLSGGIETVVGAWARAKRQPDVRWDLVAEIAKRVGDAAFRRTVLLLRLLGFDGLVEARLAEIDARKASPIFDRSREFELPKEQVRRDRETGVRMNVPPEYLRGWISGATIG
jgi:predicted transcriptional regulator of viral defense system